MHRLRLLARGLWWRRGLTLAVLAVAVVTTTAAALGPLYARAAAESILHDHLVQSSGKTGLRLSSDLTPGDPAAVRRYQGQVRAVGRVHGYDQLVHSYYTPDGVLGYIPHAPKGVVGTALLWREGQCAHLVVVRGRCPVRAGEAMVDETDFDGDVYPFRLGLRISLTSIVTGVAGVGAAKPRPLHVVGVYRPRNIAAPYWFGQNYFGPQGNASAAVPSIEPLIVGQSTFTNLPPNNIVEADDDYLLTPSAVRLDDVRAERARVAGILRAHHGTELKASSGLLPVLHSAAHDHHLIDVGTLLVALQLTLLAWLVLFQVVGNAVAARGDEIAMAKLRGHGPWATVRFGLGEPVTLLCAAIPLGLLAAFGVTHLFAAGVLAPGVPVRLPWTALLAALIAFAGGLVAVVLAAYRTLTRSVLDQWRHTDRRPGHGRVTLAIDVLLAAAAVVGLVLLLRTGNQRTTEHPTALLAPALLVFAVGIVGVRLLPPVCRRIAAATRGTRRIALFLSSRQVARRPVGLRLAALLAVAVGLATFGVAGETVTSANRAARADAEVGASRIAEVQFASGLDPIEATQKADPDGTWAMTAATWLPDGGQSVLGTVLGVDPGRLAAVARPVRGGLPEAQLAALIGGRSLPSLSLRTTALRVSVSADNMQGAKPLLRVELRSASDPYLSVEGPPIPAGRHQIVVRVPCTRTCTLRGLSWDRPTTAVQPMSGTITVTGMAVRGSAGWKALPLSLGESRAWYAERPLGQASDHVSVTRGGIVDRFANRNGGYGGIAYGADPSPIPAVVTPAGFERTQQTPKLPTVIDANSVKATFTIRRTVPLLPQVLGDGVVMNVRALDDELPAFASEATWYVWLGAHAPADYRSRLTAVGLHVVASHSLSGRSDQLARQAPALALLLLLVCAVAGAVLAVGGTAVSISAGSRRRSYELAAMRVVGVSRRSLLWAGVLEQVLLLGAAVVLGVPAGYVAARLTMPVIPEFSDTTPVPLTYGPHAVPTALFAAAFVVLLLVTAFGAARALIRVAVPARLRDAE